MRKINNIILKLWDLRENRKKSMDVYCDIRVTQIYAHLRSKDMRQPIYLIASYQLFYRGNKV